MSKVTQELQALLYLNRYSDENHLVNISELAEYLQVTPRQARRYIEDLCTLYQEFDIQTKMGRNGGYYLAKPLGQLDISENLALAMSISMRRNEQIETVLAELPNCVVTGAIDGDNYIDSKVMDRLTVIYQAILKHDELRIRYNGSDNIHVVRPYKLYQTNGTYYLILPEDGKLKTYDVRFIDEIEVGDPFRPEQKVLDDIAVFISRYGIKNDKVTTLRVKCVDKRALKNFHRYFEGKGKMDEENLTYVVESNSENEIYYPLFRISTKSYWFLDEETKNDYLRYLRNQIVSIERGHA